MSLGKWLRDRSMRLGQQFVWSFYDSLHLKRQAKLQENAGQGMLPPDTGRNAGDQHPRGGGLPEVTARFESGGIGAFYSSRFVALTLEDLQASRAQDGETLDLGMLSARLLADQEYCQKVIVRFFSQVDSGWKSESAERLREEVFHHAHLRNTSYWTLAHGWAILYRFALCYSCFRRGWTPIERLLQDADYQEMNRFLFNIYFSAAYLRSLAYPVIEGYAHFRELIGGSEKKERLARAYGFLTSAAAQCIVDIRRALGESYGEAKAEELLVTIVERVVDFPYTHTGLTDTVSYFELKQRIEGKESQEDVSLDPYCRLIRVKRALDTGLPQSPAACVRIIHDAIPAADFETELRSGLIWCFTRDLVPKQLLWFFASRLLVGRFGLRFLARIILDYMTRGGKTFDSHAYPDHPGLRLHTLNGQVLFYDPGRRLFGKSPIFVVTPGTDDPLAFEYGLRGRPRNMFPYIQLQALIMRYVAAAFFGGNTKMLRDFFFRWMPTIEPCRPKLEEWLDWLEDKCRMLTNPLAEHIDEGRDPFDSDAFAPFLAKFEALFQECWESIAPSTTEGLGKSTLFFADGFYMHGLM